MFFSKARDNKGNVLIRYKNNGQWVDIRWEEEQEYIESFALGLIKLGIASQDKVAILSENRYEWYVSDLAVQSIGAIVVPIYATNTPEQVRYILKDSEATAVVVSTANQLSKIKQFRKEIPGLKSVISMDELLPKTEGTLNFSGVLALGRSSGLQQELQARLSGISSDSLATIIYTSGTTGDPKGVMLSHKNLMCDVEATYEVMKNELHEEVMLCFLPLSHSFARTADYYIPLFHAKGIQVIAESLEKLSENLLEIKPTMFVSVPRVFEKVYGKIIAQVEAGKPVQQKIFFWALGVGKRSSPYILGKKPLPLLLKLQHHLATVLVFKKIRNAVGGRLKFASSGGAPLPKDLGEFFFALGIKIIEGYGLTETSPVMTVNPPDSFKFGTVGKPIPGCELKIAQDGEILAKGPMIMKGYYKKPEATREVIDDNGWFHTGDIGFVDSEGYLHITDRKKDIIVTAGGKNIAPQPIENRLKMSKYIEEVVIIGDKKPYCVALIVPSFQVLEDVASKEKIPFTVKEELLVNPRIKTLIDGAVAEVNRGLARYETIKKFALIPSLFTQETGELTPTLKVKRWAVEKKYKEIIEQLYEVPAVKLAADV